MQALAESMRSVTDMAEFSRMGDRYAYLLGLQARALGDPGAVEALLAEIEATRMAFAGAEPGAGQEGEPSPEALAEFQRVVDAWYRLDNQQRALASQAAALRRQSREHTGVKARLAERIMAFMSRHEFEDVSTGHGILRLVQSSARRPPSSEVLRARILELASRTMAPDEAERLVSEASQPVAVERRSLRRAPPPRPTKAATQHY